MQAILDKIYVVVGTCLVLGLTVMPVENVAQAKVKAPAKRVVKAAKEAPKAKTHHVKVKIEGMTCGGCVHRITTALKGVKGVVTSKVSLDNGSADIVCAKGLKPATVVASIKKLGYKVTLVPAKKVAKAPVKAAKKAVKKAVKKKACGADCKCKTCLKKKAAKNQG